MSRYTTHVSPAGLDLPEFVDEAYRRILDAVALAPTYSGHYVEHGSWKQVPVAQTSFWTATSYDHGNWTSGFWVGALLHLESLGGPVARELAVALAGATSARALDETTHDMGFMFWPSAALLADAQAEEGDKESAQRWASVALTAAETLARRFRAKGSYLQAFGALDDPRGHPTSTIDTMMNLPLLWWTAKWFDRADLHDIAVRHAHASIRDLVRSDGASYHIVYRDQQGNVTSRGTFQGAGDDSCWTRGQAWAVHGFIDAYVATGDDTFADMAQRCLEYWESSADLGQLPPYDLAADTGLADASAGAILASGLANAGDHPELAERLKSRQRLKVILDTLSRDAVFASNAGVLGRSTYSAPHGWGVDGALPYGDFFYLRALRSLLANSNQLPSTK